jgi:hypothetical protein
MLMREGREIALRRRSFFSHNTAKILLTYIATPIILWLLSTVADIF